MVFVEQITMSECVRNRLGKVACDGKFILISEDTRDLLVLEILLELVRNMEMLKFFLNMLGNGYVQRRMSV